MIVPPAERAVFGGIWVRKIRADLIIVLIVLIIGDFSDENGLEVRGVGLSNISWLMTDR